MANFFKYWYTLEEVAEILNSHFNDTNQLNHETFNLKDILNFYREERLRLALHIQEIDNYKPIINLFVRQIEMDCSLYDFFEDQEIKGDIHITSGDSIISLRDDYLYAKGYFSIPVQYAAFYDEKLSISAIKIYHEDQADFISGDEVDYEYGIAFSYPIEVSIVDVIVLRGDILDLIAMLEEENKNAHIYLKHNRRPELAENSELFPQLTAKDEEIACLKAEIESLKKFDIVQDQTMEFNGEIPLNTDKDKLAYFIKLIIQKSEFMKDGRMPTYSELHTMLSNKYPKEQIPSKNTLNKYLNP